MIDKVLKTRLVKPAKIHLAKLHNEMHLMENKKNWSGNWYAWEHEIKRDKHTTNKYRLRTVLLGGTHEISSIKRADGAVFKIGDLIKHNQTDEFNRSVIKSFSVVPDHITKEDVFQISFNLEGGGFFTCRLDQIELWKATESYRFDISDVRDFNVKTINKNLLLL